MNQEASTYPYLKEGQAIFSVVTAGKKESYICKAKVIQRAIGTITIDVAILQNHSGEPFEPVEYPEGIELAFEDDKETFIKSSHINSSGYNLRFSRTPTVVWHYQPRNISMLQHHDTVHKRRFELVNLAIDYAPINLVLNGKEVSIFAADNYPAYKQRLKAKEITHAVTAYLEITGGTLEEVQAIAVSICQLLSIAQGSIVEWINYTELAESGKEVARYFEDRVTKPYCPYMLIEPHKVGQFIDDAYNGFQEFQESAWECIRLIRLYLSGIDHSQFLEIRAIMLSATVEALKDNFEEIAPAPDKDARLQKYELIRKVIKDNVQDKADRKLAYNAICSIKRPGFRTEIERLLEYLNIKVDSEEISNFIASRDKLIHTAKFKTAALGITNYFTEYLSILGLVDRIMLRLIGYKGEYVDRRSHDTLKIAPAESA